MTSRFAARKMERIKQSGIRRIFELAGRMERAGREIIHFEIGRTDFDTPAPVVEAAVAAMRAGQVHYTPSSVLLELRRAIAADLKTRQGLDYDPDTEIIVTVGSTSGIMAGLMTLLDQGDEMVAAEPMYLFYLDWGEFCGARTVAMELRLEDGFQIRRPDLERRVTPRTRAVVVNSPHNPTGAVLDQTSLQAVADVARERDLVVLSDECYDLIVHPPARHVSIASLPGMKERTLISNSFSKGYAMDGWRVGYLAGPADLIWEVAKAQQHTVISATTFVQHGALAALRGGPALAAPMVAEYAARRALALDILGQAPGLGVFPPQGAFYLWIDAGPDHPDGWKTAELLLEEAGVAVTPGEVFGPSGRGRLRVSYSTSRENISRGLTRLVETLSARR